MSELGFKPLHDERTLKPNIVNFGVLVRIVDRKQERRDRDHG